MTSPFAVRLRAYAAAHFALDDQMRIAWPDATAILQSEFTGGTSGRAYPVTIFGEIRGEADSLDSAQERLGGALANVLPLLALAANAAIADPMPVAAFGTDLGSLPQPLVWYAAPHAGTFFPPGRRTIPADAALALMAAVGHRSETELLQRANESYRRALDNWVPERLLMAGEFLYIAAETLSRFLIEARGAEAGLSPKNLARREGASKPDELRRRYLRDEIFAGDESALAAMQEASNGFEHGYLAINAVRDLANPVLGRSMGLVRAALVAAAGVDEASRATLLGSEYDEPRGLVPPIYIASGRLRLTDPQAPAPTELAPLELDFPIPEPVAHETDDEEPPSITFTRTVTALALPDNIAIDVNGIGLRAAHVTNWSVGEAEVTTAKDRVGVVPRPVDRRDEVAVNRDESAPPMLHERGRASASAPSSFPLPPSDPAAGFSDPAAAYSVLFSRYQSNTDLQWRVPAFVFPVVIASLAAGISVHSSAIRAVVGFSALVAGVVGAFLMRRIELTARWDRFLLDAYEEVMLRGDHQQLRLLHGSDFRSRRNTPGRELPGAQTANWKSQLKHGVDEFAMRFEPSTSVFALMFLSGVTVFCIDLILAA